MLGGVDYLKLVKMWGHSPDDNFSDEVSDFEEKRSSGANLNQRRMTRIRVLK